MPKKPTHEDLHCLNNSRSDQAWMQAEELLGDIMRVVRSGEFSDEDAKILRFCACLVAEELMARISARERDVDESELP